jgi:hypothetical protein
MTKYLVRVYGRNFRFPFRERRKAVVKLTGFYTTRCIVASGPAEAEYKAMELIRRDPKLRRSVRNRRTDPPIMHAVEVREVESFTPLKAPGTGYVFFHGRGAGRPRTAKLAPFRPDTPKDVKRAAFARFRSPARRAPRAT